MINSVILVLVGGAFGAMLRKYLMLSVPQVDGLPLDILVANVGASFLLGLTAALHARRVFTDEVNTLLGTGVMGGLSTFSSLVYGSVVLMGASSRTAEVALLYLAASLVVDYGAVVLGLRIGRRGPARVRPSQS
ncbi:MAG: CrcB family protein [Geminicoccaceae bacterium]